MNASRKAFIYYNVNSKSIINRISIYVAQTRLDLIKSAKNTIISNHIY